MNAIRPIVLSSPARRLDPFRGSPVGESRASRRCVVLGVRMAAGETRAPEVIEPSVFDVRLGVWKNERDAAAVRGDHAQVSFLTRCIARAEAAE